MNYEKLIAELENEVKQTALGYNYIYKKETTR